MVAERTVKKIAWSELGNRKLKTGDNGKGLPSCGPKNMLKARSIYILSLLQNLQKSQFLLFLLV